METDFNRILRQQGWNTSPLKELTIPSSSNPLEAAAKTIAISAYPDPKYLHKGGKAHKYAQALLAYIIRISRLMNDIDALPPWVQALKADKMADRLTAGHRRLTRSFLIHNLITSALMMNSQSKRARKGELTTFTMQFSPDLKSLKIDIPLKETDQGTVLCGKVPQEHRASLRAAITYHLPALREFSGISPRIEGHDEELYYQNVLNRIVRPALSASHIVQIVWEAATQYASESVERNIPIDQILMRKATWAEEAHLKTEQYEKMTLFKMQELGISTCYCRLVHLGPPFPDS